MLPTLPNHKRRRSNDEDLLLREKKRTRLDPTLQDQTFVMVFPEDEKEEFPDTLDSWTQRCEQIKKELINRMHSVSLSPNDLKNITATKLDENDPAAEDIVDLVGNKELVRVSVPHGLVEYAINSMNNSGENPTCQYYSNLIANKIAIIKDQIQRAVPRLQYVMMNHEDWRTRTAALDTLTTMMHKFVSSTNSLPYLDPYLSEFASQFMTDDMDKITCGMPLDEKAVFENGQWERIECYEMMETRLADIPESSQIVVSLVTNTFGCEQLAYRMTNEHGQMDADSEADEDGDVDMKVDRNLSDGLKAIDMVPQSEIDSLAALMGNLRLESDEDLAVTDRRIADLPPEKPTNTPVDHSCCAFKMAVRDPRDTMDLKRKAPQGFEENIRFWNDVMKENITDEWDQMYDDHLPTPAGHECLRELFELKRGWTSRRVSFLFISHLDEIWENSGFFGLVESFIISRSKRQLGRIIFYLEHAKRFHKYFDGDGVRLFEILLKRSRKEHMRFKELFDLISTYLVQAHESDRAWLLLPLLITFFPNHPRVIVLRTQFLRNRILKNYPDKKVEKLCDVVDKTRIHAASFYSGIMGDYETFSSRAGRTVLAHVLQKRVKRPARVLKFSGEWEERLLVDPNAREFVTIILQCTKWRDSGALKQVLFGISTWLRGSAAVQKKIMEPNQNARGLVQLGNVVLESFREKRPKIIRKMTSSDKKKFDGQLKLLKKWVEDVCISRSRMRL